MFLSGKRKKLQNVQSDISCMLNGLFHLTMGWSGGAMALGKLPVLVCPTIWMILGQGPVALAVYGGCLDF